MTCMYAFNGLGPVVTSMSSSRWIDSLVGTYPVLRHTNLSEVVVQDGIEDRDEDDCWNRKHWNALARARVSFRNNVTRRTE
jgi:hypothetical protein